MFNSNPDGAEIGVFGTFELTEFAMVLMYGQDLFVGQSDDSRPFLDDDFLRYHPEWQRKWVEFVETGEM